MGIFGKIFGVVKVNKVRDGLYSFNDDAWRLERGPRLEEFVFTDDRRIADQLNECGAGGRYLADMRDAVGNIIQPGVKLKLHCWKSSDHVWYLYEFVDEWVQRGVIDAVEQEAINTAKRRIK